MKNISILEFVLSLSILAASVIAQTGEKASSVQQSSALDIIKNGDFETGTLEGWIVATGICQVDTDIVHGGQYSAYISDTPYNNRLEQSFLDLHVPLTCKGGIVFEGWVYPTIVGMINAQTPHSCIFLRFFNESSGTQAFVVGYAWSLSTYAVNTTTGFDMFLSSWSANQWNFLSRNVTADVCSYFGSIDFSNIVLSRIEASYHFSNADPGAFYIDDWSIFIEFEEIDVQWSPTCPSPYVVSTEPRVNEPVLVKANVTGGDVEAVLLKFRRQNGQWYNVSMVFNQTEQLWTQLIPGQSEACTLEFVVEAHYHTPTYSLTSSTYSFDVRGLPEGDVNGDGIVNIRDAAILAINWLRSTQ